MDEIKTGVVGYGFSGKIFQCPFLEAHEAYDLAAVVQRHGNEAKEDYPNINLLTSYDALLEDDSIELVIISTPSHLHYEHAKMALEAGKHVLVEKPFAATYEQARALDRLAEAKGKVITVYQNRRYDGDFLTIKELLATPDVTIYEYEAVWDRYAPDMADDWKEAGYEGANLLYDLGSHFMDQAMHLFGKPTAVDGVVKKLRPGTKIIDYFSLVLDYPSVAVRLKSSMVACRPDIRYKVHTNKGTYHFYEMGEQEHQLLAGMKPDDPLFGDNAHYDFYDLDGNKESRKVMKGNYLEFFTVLAQAIHGHGEPPVSADHREWLIKQLESFNL